MIKFYLCLQNNRQAKLLSEDESVTIKTVKGVGLILIEN